MIEINFTKNIENITKTFLKKELISLYTGELVYDFFRFIEFKFPDMFYISKNLVLDFYKKNILKDFYYNDFYDILRELNFPNCIEILESNIELKKLAYDYVKINILSFAWINYSSIILDITENLDKNINNMFGFCVRFKFISSSYDSYLLNIDSDSIDSIGSTITNHIISDLEDLSYNQNLDENDTTFIITIKDNIIKVKFRGVFFSYILLDKEESLLFGRCRNFISKTSGFNCILEGIENNKLPHSILKYMLRYVIDSSKISDREVSNYIDFSYLLFLSNNYCNFIAAAIYYALLENNISEIVHEFISSLDSEEEKIRQTVFYLDWFEILKIQSLNA